MTLASLLSTRFSFFLLIVAAGYCIGALYSLTARYRCLPPTRRFFLFNIGVVLWACKDALGEMVLPHFAPHAAGLPRFLAVISPLLLGMPLYTFNMLISTYNARISPSQRFRFVRPTNLGLLVVLTSISVAALIEPHSFYGAVHIDSTSYRVTPGPGMLIFALLLAGCTLLPAALLFRVVRRQWRSEALYMAVGAILLPLAFFATDFGWSAWQPLPMRLGCSSALLLGILTLIGIKRHGHRPHLAPLLQEHNPLRLIAAGMGGLLNVYDEDSLYRQICNHAREASELPLVSVIFFLEGQRTYEVKASSLRDGSTQALSEHNIPLTPGSVHELSQLPGLKRLLTGPAAIRSYRIEELFDFSSTKPLRLPEHAEQVFCYPIVHDSLVRGALLLVCDIPEPNVDLFSIFGVQCSLVFKFSWQIAELEKMRRLEEQLHHAQKMEAIGRLSGGIAHDFNNALSGITGYAQLIRRKCTAHEVELKEYATAIIGAARHSADLTEKLLAYARKGTLQTVPVDMHEVINQSMQLLEPTLDKRIHIRTRLRADSPTTMGDPSQLQNIIINLALNARNAMPKGGQLTIATKTVSHKRAQPIAGEYEIRPGSYVVVSVADTGIGMDPQTQRRVFEPFFTTDNSGKGSGLGLSSVYGIVKSHKGFITVDSELGKGAVFKVYLPLLKATVTEISTSPRRKTEMLIRGHGHVLVVDDDDLICRLSEEMLSFLGYSTTVVRSGSEAVTYLRDNPEAVDVAIVDVMMPRMDGYETFHQLRAIRSDIKVILTTGYTLPRDTRHMAAIGLCGFLQKPFESGTLSQVLHDALAGEVQ